MLEELKEELEGLKQAGRYFHFHPRQNRKNGRIEIRGKRVLDFTNWDFFNISSEPRVRRAIQREVELHGVGSGSSRVSSGTSPAHISCEMRLAAFLGVDAAVLFTSSNQAVLSLVAALVSERDCVLVDDAVQTPVIDASFLVNADVLNFKSEDPDTLARVLDKTDAYRRKFLFLRSVSPVDGRVNDLPALIDAAANHEVFTLVDEGFALGSLGARGAGGVEHFNLKDKVFCVYGTLAKGGGCYGAFVGGSRVLIDYLINRSRTFTSENALPQFIATAVEAALNLIELNHSGREKLVGLAMRLTEGLGKLGYKVQAGTRVPVVCLPLANRTAANEICEALFQRGFLAEVLSGDFLLSNQAVLRLIVNSAHSSEDIDLLLEGFLEIKKRLKE